MFHLVAFANFIFGAEPDEGRDSNGICFFCKGVKPIGFDKALTQPVNATMTGLGTHRLQEKKEPRTQARKTLGQHKGCWEI